MNERSRPNDCFLHGDEGREPWGRPFRQIEVVRCDHLGAAYVVEMVLIAGSEERPARSRHIHFVRGRRREIHALDEGLSEELVEEVWQRAVMAMERGDVPRDAVAEFHGRVKR